MSFQVGIFAFSWYPGFSCFQLLPVRVGAWDYSRALLGIWLLGKNDRSMVINFLYMEFKFD